MEEYRMELVKGKSIGGEKGLASLSFLPLHTYIDVLTSLLNARTHAHTHLLPSNSHLLLLFSYCQFTPPPLLFLYTIPLPSSIPTSTLHSSTRSHFHYIYISSFRCPFPHYLILSNPAHPPHTSPLSPPLLLPPGQNALGGEILSECRINLFSGWGGGCGFEEGPPAIPSHIRLLHIYT